MIFGRDIVERRSWILDVYVVEALLPTEFKTVTKFFKRGNRESAFSLGN